jgi:hypothetical protein
MEPLSTSSGLGRSGDLGTESHSKKVKQSAACSSSSAIPGCVTLGKSSPLRASVSPSVKWE